VHRVLLSTGPLDSKAAFLESARMLTDLGTSLYATAGTAEFLRSAGIVSTVLYWPLEDRFPNVLEYLRTGQIDLVINIPKNTNETELTNDYIIRRRAVDFGIPLITNLQLAQRFVEALSRKQLNDLQIKSWSDYTRLSTSRLIRPHRVDKNKTLPGNKMVARRMRSSLYVRRHRDVVN